MKGETAIRAEIYSGQKPLGNVTEIEQNFQDIVRILDSVDCEVYLIHGETLRILHANRTARENLGFSIRELRQITPFDHKRDFMPGYFASFCHGLYSPNFPIHPYRLCGSRSTNTASALCGAYSAF